MHVNLSWCLSLFIFSGTWCCASAQDTAIELLASKIDHFEQQKEEHVKMYTRVETYKVYRGSNQLPTAEMRVSSTYERGSGNVFQILDSKGSVSAKTVVKKSLEKQKQLSKQPERRGIAVMTDNYEMSIAGPDSVDGQDCVSLVLKAKRRSPYLLEGRACVNKDGELLQVKGETVASPSIWTGRLTVERKFTLRSGFSFPATSVSESSSWIFGKTRVIVAYDYSRIDID